MKEMQIFENKDFGEIRTLEENGKVLFCGSDVAKALGYSNPRDALARHCKGVVKRDGVSDTTNQHGTTTKQVSTMSFIPEGDVYRLITHSKLPAAEKFEAWVFDEVVPSIQKHGGYIAGQETLTAEELMAKALLMAQKTLAEREARISTLTVENQILQPKAEYFDSLVDRNLLTSFRETARQMNVGEREFVQFLLSHKYIYRNKKGKLMPYAERDSGLFEVKECINDKTGWCGTQTLITPKGRETFRLLMIGNLRKNA